MHPATLGCRAESQGRGKVIKGKTARQVAVAGDVRGRERGMQGPGDSDPGEEAAEATPDARSVSAHGRAGGVRGRQRERMESTLLEGEDERGVSFRAHDVRGGGLWVPSHEVRGGGLWVPAPLVSFLKLAGMHVCMHVCMHACVYVR